jgi:FKBP-type peptidyl-prolyl cis-trans isomerase SlyD
MAIAEGSKVSINYTLTVDGVVIDSSDGGDPLTYTQGSGEIIPGLEAALAGLGVGDKKSVVVGPAEGYGERNPQATQKIPRTSFKDDKGLEVGLLVSGKSGDQEFQAMVAEVDAEHVTLDFNHPLAGKTLHFEIEIMKVE